MYYIIPTPKSLDQACADLEAAAKRHGFGVLHVHDIGATLRSKGVAFSGQARVFEICNPVQASKVLSIDMRLNMALPCRISVYVDRGQTHIGLIEPVQMLAALSDQPALLQIADEVQGKMIQMADEAS